MSQNDTDSGTDLIGEIGDGGGDGLVVSGWGGALLAAVVLRLFLAQHSVLWGALWGIWWFLGLRPLFGGQYCLQHWLVLFGRLLIPGSENKENQLTELSGEEKKRERDRIVYIQHSIILSLYL